MGQIFHFYILQHSFPLHQFYRNRHCPPVGLVVRRCLLNTAPSSSQSSAASMWTVVLPLENVAPPSTFLCLTDLLQQFLFYQFKLHADGHFCNELVTSFLGHLFAVSQVNVTYASTALEIGQRLVCDPVTD